MINTYILWCLCKRNIYYKIPKTYAVCSNLQAIFNQTNERTRLDTYVWTDDGRV